ncbi:rhodanese-like domain-containing protein [Geomonas sp.]|uniref:rhodanese-like domain-containing protein n=1 Tax=Geomonas sp. TaxID=2651584 RepID=UPI002B4A0122|nr:rhodanese-like domain-containing protein [Geomonas sp.]HJV33907.1 rhodanese-like domain-containing protein [Geomonas sp.]
MKKLWHSTLLEICLIVVVSALAGVAWNRTLLTNAWHGGLTQQAEARTEATAAPAGEELLPMPIPIAQVKQMHDAKEAVVVDARSKVFFAQGHIAGAILLPLEDAKKAPAALAGKFARDATIIAYCNGFSCHDSMELAKILMKAGYTSVYVYEGGFPEWRDAGYPVATGGV